MCSGIPSSSITVFVTVFSPLVANQQPNLIIIKEKPSIQSSHAQTQTWVRRVAQSQSWERVIVVVKAAGGACGGWGGGAPAVGAGAAALP